MSGEKKFAVLIDSDNVSDKYIKIILDEISNDGITTYKRIYGDWTKTTQASWKSVLLNYSITPVQQYAYTTGKNATDSAMIIDAMDILYSGNVDGFALVSSDSDFTRLASRLRESGMTVVGMGERKTPSAFIAACNKFKYLDVLAKAETPKSVAQVDKGDALESVKQAVVTIVAENSDEDGWAFIGDIGNVLNKRFPDFDVRNFGYSKLTPFMKSLGIFEDRTERTNDNGRQVFLRVRSAALIAAVPVQPMQAAQPVTPTQQPAIPAGNAGMNGNNARRRVQGMRQQTSKAVSVKSAPQNKPTPKAELPASAELAVKEVKSIDTSAEAAISRLVAAAEVADASKVKTIAAEVVTETVEKAEPKVEAPKAEIPKESVPQETISKPVKAEAPNKAQMPMMPRLVIAAEPTVKKPAPAKSAPMMPILVLAADAAKLVEEAQSKAAEKLTEKVEKKEQEASAEAEKPVELPPEKLPEPVAELKPRVASEKKESPVPAKKPARRRSNALSKPKVQSAVEEKPVETKPEPEKAAEGKSAETKAAPAGRKTSRVAKKPVPSKLAEQTAEKKAPVEPTQEKSEQEKPVDEKPKRRNTPGRRPEKQSEGGTNAVNQDVTEAPIPSAAGAIAQVNPGIAQAPVNPTMPQKAEEK